MGCVKEAPNCPARRHCFGTHLSIAGGVHNAIAAALRLRCDTVQVFVKNQRQWRAPPLDTDDVARWHELAATPGFGPAIAHATYLINLASPDRALARRSRGALVEELRRCETLNIPYLVVHPGSATDGQRGRGVVRVARALDRVFEVHPEFRTMTLLESTAGQGMGLGATLEELADIIGAVREPDRVGVCLDTCHVFAAGYDLRTPDKYAALITAAARTVGLDRIRCWHVNDSRGDCGSRLDRHEHIGRGQIGAAGFRNLLRDPHFVGVPMILETPKGTDDAGRDFDRLNLQRLRRMAARAGAQPRLA